MPMMLGLLIAGGAWAAPARLPLECDADPGWQPRPTYLPNPADRPEVSLAEGALHFRAGEPGRGMKWELPVLPFDVEREPYLVLRYRAAGLAGDWVLYVSDGTAQGTTLLRAEDLEQDGEWHVLAVDLWARGARGAVRSLFVQAVSGTEPAELALDYVRLAVRPPGEARVLPAEAPPEAEVTLRAADLGNLQPQPKWLAAPAEQFSATVEEGVLHLSASGAGRGMKFSIPLPEPLDLRPFRWVAIRYRAQDAAPWGDYLLWLGNEPKGEPQQWVSAMALNQVRGGGDWRVAVLPLEAPFEAVMAAVQVSCAQRRGDVWLDTIRFSSRRPVLQIGEVLPVSEGWGESRLDAADCSALDLSSVCNGRADSYLAGEGLGSWFAAGSVTVRGIPFRVAAGEVNVVASPDDINAPCEVPVGAQGTEAYLLLAARLGSEYDQMGQAHPMDRFDTPERFVVRVNYEDGVGDDVFPVCLGSGTHEVAASPEVYCVPALRPVPVRSLALRNRMESARFLLAAVTVNAGRPLTAEPAVPGLPPFVPPRATAAAVAGPAIEPVEGGFRVGSDLCRLDLQTTGGIRLRGLTNGLIHEAALDLQPGPLFTLGSGDRQVSSEEVTVGEPRREAGPDGEQLVVPFDATPQGVPLQGELVVTPHGDEAVDLRLNVTTTGEAVVTPRVEFPVLGPVRIGRPADTWYLWASKGGIISNQPTHQRQAYGGAYPLQVADLFHRSGGGLALLTLDQEGIYRDWDLVCDDRGVSWRVAYWPYEHHPGEAVATATARLQAHSGDWREALRLYADWAHTWYRPQAPRKAWFQRCFYYQQRYAWEDLRNQETGEWRMDEVIRRYRDYFGRLDYLHIFDFGQSPTYGRVGDYNHYDELGGLPAMRAAIAEAQRQGVRVGLYIEGYLCDERSVWGREHVAANEIIQQGGSPLLWSPGSTEHMMCPAAEGWRSHLAETFARVARELGPDGLYCDQYGFQDPGKTCWSREHGHPVPWPPMLGERETTQAIRNGLPDGVATLTEDTPHDINSQFQDGALSYSVWSADPALMPHRAHLSRFVFPSFKVFQLVSYSPFTEGGWQRLKFPFFNGEGYWLHGGTDDFYCEDAARFLRQAFAILHDHADAFTSDDVEALVPTLDPAVYANCFRSRDEVVWTLFNGHYRTFRGDVLRVPYEPGVEYTEAFSGKALQPKRAGRTVTLAVELAPQGIGCIVARRPSP